MTDFDAVFFIRMQKTTKVTWATKKFEKNEKKGTFFAKNVFSCGRQRNYQKHLLALQAMCRFTQKKSTTYGDIIIIKVRPLKLWPKVRP